MFWDNEYMISQKLDTVRGVTKVYEQFSCPQEGSSCVRK